MQQPTLPTHTATVPGASAAESNEASGDAPPKQVAMALERLGQASRLIADIRIGADRLLEALFVAAQGHHTSKPLHLILKEEASMRQHLQHLHSVGKQLEDSGVLNDSLRSRSNSWGLHMPLVCPDGAVVAYAWKRQLAGQAGASAVDRTRAIVSVSPAGSLDPDAVAFFSPDEGGSYVHARGFSVHHVFRHITKHAAMALQHFTGVGTETALLSLLFWVSSYQTLFSKVCSKCSRLLSMDKESAVLLPPVNRPYRNFCAGKFLSKSLSKEDQSVDSTEGFHIDCFSQEA